MYNTERNFISNRGKSHIKLPEYVVTELKKEGIEPGPKRPNQVIARFWAGTPGISDCLF